MQHGSKDHPDEFPPHEGVPLKGLDESLSYYEACTALKMKIFKTEITENII